MRVVAALGWCAAGALLFEMRRRSALLADAAHELRGPVTALSLGLEALRSWDEALADYMDRAGFSAS